MASNLRKRIPISYYEPEEPSFDDYVYCEQCSDYVFEYCAIHGPMLVIPDDKIPLKTNFPSYVPRAALTIPHVFLHLAPSIIPGAGLGVFSTLTLPRGVRFGPYRGRRAQEADSLYCWQIYDRNNKRSHVVDAADGDRSNWMRYVNCARHWREQNLLAYQYQGQLYYRTIKIIPRFTELMVFYGSEFANALHINLSKYNSKKYYEEVIRRTTGFEEKDDVIMDDSSAILKENIGEEIHEEYVHQFEFIDEECEDKENNQTNCSPTLENTIIPNNNILNNIDNTSPIQVTLTGDNITINFDNNTEKTFKCEICEKTFANIRYLRKHSKLHIAQKYTCELCTFSTNFKDRYDEHIDKHTQSFLYSCPMCFYKTNIKKYYNRHCLRHKNNRIVLKSIIPYNDVYFSAPKVCDLCEFETCSRKKFALHQSKHRGNIYMCDLCDYSNSIKYNLSRHIFRRHKP